MEPTEPMEWITINYAGVEIQATNFLDGVLVVIPSSAGTHPVYCPDWYVQEQRGDMDGPAFHKFKEPKKIFGIQIVEAR